MKILRQTIHGLEHQCYLWGNEKNPPLFFLHGWMDTGASFDALAQHLSSDYYCIAFDLRGFGKTEHCDTASGYFFYEYLLDLYEILRRFGAGSMGGKIRLVGHSMGGNIASLYAGTFPEHVSHLVNLEGVGPQGQAPEKAPERVREWIEDAHLDKPENRFRDYPTIEALAERLKKANPHLTDNFLQVLLPFLTKRSAQGFSFSADAKHKWLHPFLIPLEQYFEFWRRIEAKCLLVTAENSDIGGYLQRPRDAAKEIARRFSNYPKGTTTVVIPSAGHMFHQEKPEELAKLIQEFLSQNN